MNFSNFRQGEKKLSATYIFAYRSKEAMKRQGARVEEQDCELRFAECWPAFMNLIQIHANEYSISCSVFLFCVSETNSCLSVQAKLWSRGPLFFYITWPSCDRLLTDVLSLCIRHLQRVRVRVRDPSTVEEKNEMFYTLSMNSTRETEII